MHKKVLSLITTTVLGLVIFLGSISFRIIGQSIILLSEAYDTSYAQIGISSTTQSIGRLLSALLTGFLCDLTTRINLSKRLPEDNFFVKALKRIFNTQTLMIFSIIANVIPNFLVPNIRNYIVLAILEFFVGFSYQSLMVMGNWTCSKIADESTKSALVHFVNFANGFGAFITPTFSGYIISLDISVESRLYLIFGILANCSMFMIILVILLDHNFVYQSIENENTKDDLEALKIIEKELEEKEQELNVKEEDIKAGNLQNDENSQKIKETKVEIDEEQSNKGNNQPITDENKNRNSLEGKIPKAEDIEEVKDAVSQKDAKKKKEIRKEKIYGWILTLMSGINAFFFASIASLFGTMIPYLKEKGYLSELYSSFFVSTYYGIGLFARVFVIITSFFQIKSIFLFSISTFVNLFVAFLFGLFSIFYIDISILWVLVGIYGFSFSSCGGMVVSTLIDLGFKLDASQIAIVMMGVSSGFITPTIVLELMELNIDWFLYAYIIQNILLFFSVSLFFILAITFRGPKRFFSIMFSFTKKFKKRKKEIKN